jgi:hypothetical protein
MVHRRIRTHNTTIRDSYLINYTTQYLTLIDDGFMLYIYIYSERRCVLVHGARHTCVHEQCTMYGDDVRCTAYHVDVRRMTYDTACDIRCTSYGGHVWNMTYNARRMTYDVRRLTHDVWRKTYSIQHLTYDVLCAKIHWHS